MEMNEDRRELLRKIPKMDEMISVLEGRGIFKRASRNIVLKICRSVIEGIRSDILADKPVDAGALDPEKLAGQLSPALKT
jgi:hypothetical protein